MLCDEMEKKSAKYDIGTLFKEKYYMFFSTKYDIATLFKENTTCFFIQHVSQKFFFFLETKMNHLGQAYANSLKENYETCYQIAIITITHFEKQIVSLWRGAVPSFSHFEFWKLEMPSMRTIVRDCVEEKPLVGHLPIQGKYPFQICGIFTSIY